MNPDSFCYVNLTSLCVPASVVSFEGPLVTFRCLLEILTFESPQNDPVGRRCPDLIGSPMGDAVCPVYQVGGNRHFAVVGDTFMDFARTILIDHCDDRPLEVTIDSTVEELAPGAFMHISCERLLLSSICCFGELGGSLLRGARI
jgi:hypothetical protein